MYDHKKNIEEILSRNNLGIYNLMKFHFGIGNQITKKFPYADLTRIFSEKKQIDQKIILKIGSSLELLNASFEVHEDVRNGNTERNKTESLWWKYGPAQAINVGDGSRIAANAVVVNDVQKNTTMVGVPAKAIKTGYIGNFIPYGVDKNVKDEK